MLPACTAKAVANESLDQTRAGEIRLFVSFAMRYSYELIKWLRSNFRLKIIRQRLILNKSCFSDYRVLIVYVLKKSDSLFKLELALLV